MLGLFTSCVLAQDATVTPLTWRNPVGAPDELPKLKDPLKVVVPPELKASPDINYVIYDVYLGPKGETLGQIPLATLPYISDTFFENRPHKNSTFWKPGRRGGKGVNTETSFAIIFNPASASEISPDATPRLLSVSAVRRRLPPETKNEDMPNRRAILAEVEVDEQGLVTAVNDAPPEFARDFELTAKTWRFAPARRAGKPVAAKVRLPFVVDWYRWVYEATTHSRIPKVISQRRPEYPMAMRAAGMKATVLVEFQVDIEGRVRNAFASHTSNPSFDDAALDAVRQWRFEPGTEDGRPVQMRMAVPIVFELNEYGRGNDAVVTTSKGDLSKLPEQYRYDIAPLMTEFDRAVYPYSMLRTLKEGRAVVRYVVGPDGRVNYLDVAEATTPEFGAALVAAVECFQFRPAMKNGQPSSAMLAFEAEFHTGEEGADLVSAEDLDLMARELKDPKSIITMKGLDAPLQPLSQKPPRFPISLAKTTKSGRAIIEILVDEEGRVRLPRIVEATAPAFGYAAIQSVSRWRFEPPTRGSQPVVVRVRVPVEFSAKGPAAPP